MTQLFTAFSRDGPTKQYVQHLMLQDEQVRATLTRLLQQEGAYVYVCGATAMGADVHQAFSTLTSAAFVKGLQDSGRYVQELWSV